MVTEGFCGCPVTSTVKLQKLPVFAFLISYSSQFQSKHLQYWPHLQEDFLTIGNTYPGMGCRQSGMLPVSGGPSRDICLSRLTWEQCPWEEGWTGRGLKSLWIPKPHFITSTLWGLGARSEWEAEKNLHMYVEDLLGGEIFMGRGILGLISHLLVKMKTTSQELSWVLLS